MHGMIIEPMPEIMRSLWLIHIKGNAPTVMRTFTADNPGIKVPGHEFGICIYSVKVCTIRVMLMTYGVLISCDPCFVWGGGAQ